MRKLMAVVFALMLIFHTGAITFADSILAEGDLQQIHVPISATYKANEEVKPVFSADIVWGGIDSFVFNDSPKTWQPGFHSYTESSPGAWSGEAIFFVANHSNFDLKVDFSFHSSLVAGELTVQTDILHAAVEGTAQDAADSVETLLTITSGKILENTASVGTLTVTLGAA